MNRQGKFVLITLSLILAAGTAQARIGETMDQCIERYGSPRSQRIVSIDGKSLPWVQFQKMGLSVEITFLKGIAERIVYSSTYALSPERETGIDLSRGVALLLLDKNSCRETAWHQVLANTDIAKEAGTISASFFQRDGRHRSRIAHYHHTSAETVNRTDSSGSLDIRTSLYIEIVKRLPPGI